MIKVQTIDNDTRLNAYQRQYLLEEIALLMGCVPRGLGFNTKPGSLNSESLREKKPIFIVYPYEEGCAFTTAREILNEKFSDKHKFDVQWMEIKIRADASGECMASFACQKQIKTLLQTKEKRLLFLISVGQHYHENNYLKAVVNLFHSVISSCERLIQENQDIKDLDEILLEKLKGCWNITVVAADTLQAYNHVNISNETNSDLVLEETRRYWAKQGSEWIAHATPIFKMLEFSEENSIVPRKICIVTWAQILLDAKKLYYAYDTVFTDLSRAYEEGKSFSKAVERQGQDYNARLNSGTYHIAGYNFCLMADNAQLKNNTLYIEKENDLLKYTVLLTSGKIETSAITAEDLTIEIKEPLTLRALKPYLARILEISFRRGHACHTPSEINKHLTGFNKEFFGFSHPENIEKYEDFQRVVLNYLPCFQRADDPKISYLRAIFRAYHFPDDDGQHLQMLTGLRNKYTSFIEYETAVIDHLNAAIAKRAPGNNSDIRILMWLHQYLVILVYPNGSIGNKQDIDSYKAYMSKMVHREPYSLVPVFTYYDPIKNQYYPLQIRNGFQIKDVFRLLAQFVENKQYSSYLVNQCLLIKKILLSTPIDEFPPDIIQIKIDTSHTFNLPEFEIESFVHRETYINQLDHYFNKTSDSKTILKPLVIHGMVGFGKKELAKWYVNYSKRRYSWRIWIDASEIYKIFNNLVERLGLPTETSQATKRTALNDWFTTHSNCLLVIADAENFDTVKNFIPQNAHVIITSYKSKWPIDHVETLLVDCMKKEEAISLVKKVSGLDLNSSSLVDNEVGYYPLIWKIAARTMKDSLDRVGCTVNNIESEQRALSAISDFMLTYHRADFEKERIEALEDKVVYKNLHKIIRHIRGKQNSISIPLELIYICSHVARDELPIEVIGSIRRKYLSDRSNDDKTYFSELQPLVDYHLIKYDNTSRTLSIHPYLRQFLSIHSYLYWKNKSNTVDIILDAFDNEENFTKAQSYLLHLEVLANLAMGNRIIEYRIKHKMALFYTVTNPKMAIRLCNEILSTKDLTEELKVALSKLLAYNYEAIGDYTMMLKTAQTLADDDGNHDINHCFYLAIINILRFATDYRNNNKHYRNKCLEYITSIKIRLQMAEYIDEKYPHFVRAKYSFECIVKGIYVHNPKTSEFENLSKYEDMKDVKGTLALAQSYFHNYSGDGLLAIFFAKIAIKAFRQYYGEGHIETARAKIALAQGYIYLNKLEKAHKWYERGASVIKLFFDKYNDEVFALDQLRITIYILKSMRPSASYLIEKILDEIEPRQLHKALCTIQIVNASQAMLQRRFRQAAQSENKNEFERLILCLNDVRSNDPVTGMTILDYAKLGLSLSTRPLEAKAIYVLALLIEGQKNTALLFIDNEEQWKIHLQSISNNTRILEDTGYISENRLFLGNQLSIEKELRATVSAENPDTEKVKNCITAIININAQSLITGRTALHLAVRHRAYNCVALLLQSKHINLSITDIENKKAEDYIKPNDSQMLKLFLRTSAPRGHFTKAVTLKLERDELQNSLNSMKPCYL